MKTTHVASLAVALYILGKTGFTGATSLMITGVIDGPLTGGTPKAVELYVASDISDLSIYGLGFANNGGGSDGIEFTFPAISASSGNFLYVASENEGFFNFFGFTPDSTSSKVNINGDDAIELFNNGTVVDVFGNIAEDGTGQPWDYLDGWAYRNDATGGLATAGRYPVLVTAADTGSARRHSRRGTLSAIERDHRPRRRTGDDQQRGRPGPATGFRCRGIAPGHGRTDRRRGSFRIRRVRWR